MVNWFFKSSLTSLRPSFGVCVGCWHLWKKTKKKTSFSLRRVSPEYTWVSAMAASDSCTCSRFLKHPSLLAICTFVKLFHRRVCAAQSLHRSKFRMVTHSFIWKAGSDRNDANLPIMYYVTAGNWLSFFFVTEIAVAAFSVCLWDAGMRNTVQVGQWSLWSIVFVVAKHFSCSGRSR